MAKPSNRADTAAAISAPEKTQAAGHPGAGRGTPLDPITSKLPFLGEAREHLAGIAEKSPAITPAQLAQTMGSFKDVVGVAAPTVAAAARVEEESLAR